MLPKGWAAARGAAVTGCGVDLALEKAGLTDHFSVIVSAEDVTRTKPDPEVYQKALQRLNEHPTLKTEKTGVLPSECLVIEDSAPGIQAAKAAGMPVLGLTHTVESSHLSGADRILPSLAGVSLQEVESMFQDL